MQAPPTVAAVSVSASAAKADTSNLIKAALFVTPERRSVRLWAHALEEPTVGTEEPKLKGHFFDGRIVLQVRHLVPAG